MPEQPMTQSAPYPTALADLVSRLTYKANWCFNLREIDRGQGSEGLTLTIQVVGPDTYHHEINRGVLHFFIVPAASYNEQSWRRWLFDRVIEVETHEACEWFVLDDDFRPFAPNHGPGHDPYTVRELSTDEERRTSFRGDVKTP